MKPQTLCKLKAGQLIDTQENFVETFNWMVDYLNNLKGSEIPYSIKSGDAVSIKIKNVDWNHPEIAIEHASQSNNNISSEIPEEPEEPATINIIAYDKEGNTTECVLSSGCSLIFQTGDNSNMSFVCQPDSEGNVVLKTDTYWKTS